MRVKDNGQANLHDANCREQGFCCMKLVVFLTEDGVKDWDEWHGHTSTPPAADAATGHAVRYTESETEKNIITKNNHAIQAT